ncbi:MAG TPA: family 10 glycosylhydrolase [Candidatus Anammoximicrobium sp.]|nr:family 10 glycosylhydrolase [Candidatus Anammoximicrobium sp.]
MQRTIIPLAILLVTTALFDACAQDLATLNVVGRGAEGRTPYRGGGAVKFLDVSLGAQVVHYKSGEQLPLPLEIACDVLEEAPVLLTSRLGSEHWRLYHFGAETMTALYTDEKIDLAQRGTQTAKATKAWFSKSSGPLPDSGLVGIRGHYYFLIDQPNGKWIDVTDPPAFFDQPQVSKKLTFTLADVSKFELSIPEIQSTWKPGGPFRVRLVVTDAKGATQPVVNAPLQAASGTWRAALTTTWTPLNEPTGWMAGTLPDTLPEELTITGTVTVATSAGRQQREVTAGFRQGEGRVGPDNFKIATQGYELPRNKDGAIRETRAIWAGPSDIRTAADIDTLVHRCREARLNTIIPDIFVRNEFIAKSPLMPTADSVEDGFDPLRCLIEKAHAARLEVHPWFCVTYRDRRFRRWFAEKHGTNVEMIDNEGKAIDLGADVHRPEYRQFIVDLMVGVARDYPVDGIHLDYIRSMNRCFCDSCQTQFAKQYANPLAEATEDDWIVWQRQAIGEIVERTAKGVRQVRPTAKMSAAVFANLSGGASQGQDPARWAQEGWMDLIIPMDYQMQTLQVRANERQFLAALADDDQLVTGLSLYARSGDKVTSRPPELVRQQIEFVRQMGIRGYCLFAYTHLSEPQCAMLRDQVNAEPAVPYFIDNR